MATPSTPKSYVGVRITIGTTAVNLATAVSAVDSNAPVNPKSISIQSDFGTAAGVYLLIGDSSLSTSRYGFQMDPGSGRGYGPSAFSIPYQAIYVMAASSTLVANIELGSF